MASIIIPVFNEEKVLRRNFRYLESLKKDTELIFVDGGSNDETVKMASRLGTVLKGGKGRARQMNHGAKAAKGDMLLFLHADSLISKNAISSARKSIENGAIGGCFTQCLNNEKPIYRIIEEIGNRRAKKYNIFYGDQGIFVRKDIFFRLGGFPEVPVMEDVLFSKVLRKTGKLEVLDDIIYVSTRRWERNGFLKTNLSYIVMTLLFYLHIPLPAIKRLYKNVR